MTQMVHLGPNDTKKDSEFQSVMGSEDSQGKLSPNISLTVRLKLLAQVSSHWD